MERARWNASLRVRKASMFLTVDPDERERVEKGILFFWQTDVFYVMKTLFVVIPFVVIPFVVVPFVLVLIYCSEQMQTEATLTFNVKHCNIE